MVEATTDLERFELSDDYAPDVALGQLGFQERFMFARQEDNSFFTMFGIAHLGICKRLGQSQPCLQSLKGLESYSKKHQNAKEAISGILRVCKGFGTEDSKDPFNDFALIPLLKKYQALGKSAVGVEQVWTEELLVSGISQLFQVQVVLLVHKENGLEAVTGLLDTLAPVVTLEKVSEMYSTLIPKATEEHLHLSEARVLRRTFQQILIKPRVPSNRSLTQISGQEKKRSLTPKISTKNSVHMTSLVEVESDTFKQKLEFLNEKERNLRSLVEIQNSLLRSLLPVLETSQSSLLSAGFSQTLQSASQLSSYLEVDSSVYSDMLTVLQNSPSVETAEHSPEQCAKYTFSLVALRCGHLLCKKHAVELASHCPFGCS